ncbi:hypothetical protein K6U58_11340 [Vibrio fluvialis]|uniref:hypothetical protein n=1 Tax=Vibrio fluvialis TaxID=676 RepID=UPI001EEB010D|nr:hypothetical protein [Vibrio fluvialis]MCG6359172.1 hypothetical protein [Vibrio fluvialis]
MIDNKQYLFRFRKTSNLLETYEELEKQSIFFAYHGDLNDPMEGYANTYWQGDYVCWKNLFLNYIHSLEKSCREFISGSMISQVDLLFNPRQSKDKELLNSIENRFFSICEISEFIETLSHKEYKLTEIEMVSYLRIINSIALGCIFDEYDIRGFLSLDAQRAFKTNEKMKEHLKLLKDKDKSEQTDNMDDYFYTIQHVKVSFDHIDIVRRINDGTESPWDNRIFLLYP